jgi:hypothetical protein
VRLDVSAEGFIERFREIERFERGPGIPQIGRFSAPPTYADLETLTLETSDIDALRNCHPGDCPIKLSGGEMRRFQRDIDWASPNAADQVTHLVRWRLLTLVRTYQTDGNAALGRYDDGDEPLDVAEQFRALLKSDEPRPMPVPALLTYLDKFPKKRPAGAEDFLYWTVVRFGLKPTIRVNHVTIYPMAEDQLSEVAYVIAIKQLYASHYFHTTLELRYLLVDGRRTNESGISLISITRSRNDGMTGFRGLFLRPIISRRSRAGVAGYLEHVKRQVEAPDPVF